MKIITLDSSTISYGLASFDLYRRAKLCGPESGVPHEAGLMRPTGPRTLPGIIAACIENGLDHEYEILPIASKASRCRVNTAQAVLSALSGPNSQIHLWEKSDHEYRNHRDLNRLREWVVPAFMVA